MRPCQRPIAQPLPSPLLLKRSASRRRADRCESELPIVSLVSPCFEIVRITLTRGGLARTRSDGECECCRDTVQTGRARLLFPIVFGPETDERVRGSGDR